MKIRPWHAALLVGLALGGLLVAQYFFEGGARRSSYERVTAGAGGVVTLDLEKLQPGAVRFYNFLSPSNQEVDFFVGRDKNGVVQVGYDASEVCAKRRRGFRHEGEWMVCNTCDKAFRLTEVNDDHGGCAPVALRHRVDGGHLLIAESDILAGWRLFH